MAFETTSRRVAALEDGSVDILAIKRELKAELGRQIDSVCEELAKRLRQAAEYERKRKAA